MADIKPSVAPKATSSVQPARSSNSISWIAPLTCIVLGYVIWRFVLGADGNFTNPDKNGGFWPDHHGPKGAFVKMYEGGILVPLLIGAFLTVVTFVIERFLTVQKAAGTGNITEFIRKVQFHLANKDVDKAIAECDKQKGSVGNVMKSGLKRYKEMIHAEGITTEQKIIVIQKEIEEATALELSLIHI